MNARGVRIVAPGATLDGRGEFGVIVRAAGNTLGATGVFDQIGKRREVSQPENSLARLS